MKQFFNKIMSLAMAFVVLFSTMSFAVNMHYCGGTLVESALLHNAKGCGMEMENPSTEGCSITMKNCCDDEQLAIEGQDELQLHVDKITFDQQVFIASFVYTYINLFEGSDTDISSFKEYKPPLVIRRIYKIDETYLI
ncbi:hypothetical protein [Altibacter sp.]|uniref:HYC_CC_PP family protein n=1 Tax=Altibacter sp. TaxID=2024823 RepID=UPI00258C5469|nr:hypothetical protein [Altibacter sp.]MCW9037646.1 hypothetical protein [Altibacter sp.]